MIAASVLLLLLLGGCGSAVIESNQNQSLSPDETIVLTNIRGNVGMLVLTSDGPEVNLHLKYGDNYLALRLKKGHTYKVDKFSWSRNMDEGSFQFKDPLEFTLTSDDMIYIGDIDLVSKFNSSREMLMALLAYDRETETIEKLREMYPALFDKYRYRKVLIQ